MSIKRVPELHELDCKIHVDASGVPHELATELGQLLCASVDGSSLVAECGEIDVTWNPDFDMARRVDFPDGFLHFRFFVELYARGTAQSDCRGAVATILEYFWSRGVPALAACDYEAELPHGGGYKDSAIPWPVKRTGP